MDTSVSKPQTRTGDQVLDRAGDNHLAGPCLRSHPRPDVHGDPAEAVANHLALPCVQARSNRDPEVLDGIPNRARAPYRPRRPVERGEEAVASNIGLVSTKPLELGTHQAIERFKQVTPAAIPEFCGLLGRAHDIHEENGGEQPVGLRAVPDAGQELLDLVQDRVLIPDER